MIHVRVHVMGCWEGGHMTNFLKWSKTKFVALHCSFQDQLELCSKLLPLWRYKVKDFQKCCIFFCFLHFSQWKQHQITWFHHIWKAKGRGYNCCTMGNLPKKEVVYPKREIGIDSVKDKLRHDITEEVATMANVNSSQSFNMSPWTYAVYILKDSPN